MANVNLYHWENYLQSGGYAVVSSFERFLEYGCIDGLYELIVKLISEYNPVFVNAIETFEEQMLGLNDDLIIMEKIKEDLRVAPEPELDINEDWEESRKQIAESWSLPIEKVTDFDILCDFIFDIEYKSLLYSYGEPSLRIPYFFKLSYHVLTSICSFFEIVLPACPKRKDSRARYYHYYEICECMHEFRESMGWTPAMLWAFLYDFAPKAVGVRDWLWKNPPKPRAAYFIGGSKNDYYLKERNLDKDYITLWQANPDAQPGDLHVMYITYPNSRVEYIWQAVSPGFIDPFFYHYRCIYIGNVIKTPYLTQKEMKLDPILSALPIVRKNMQGVDGTPIPPSAYNHIIDLLEQKQPGVNTYHKFDTKYEQADVKIQSEADVEIMLLEPLLAKLGWSKSDYVRQMPLRMGRNHTVYPDYAIKPDFTPGREKAYFVWEAKRSINNSKQLHTDIGQAVTYARRLNAHGLGLISPEGIWYALVDDDYKTIHPLTWENLQDIDKFATFSEHAGAKTNKRKDIG